MLKIKLQKKIWDVVEYDNDYMKIKFESKKFFLIDKDVNIHIAIIIIREIFAKDGKYYPQLFLDDGLYKKLVSEKIDISDGINIDMPDKSKECMLCHYLYFLDKSFSYGPYLCDGCYNIMQKCNKLKNFVIVHIKENVYRICFLCMSKRAAKKIND